MGQLVRQGNVRVITKDGELVIQLTLDININLNQSGGINIAVSGDREKGVKDSTLVDVNGDDAAWEIPDFASHTKLDFGKPVKEEE